MTIPKKGKAFFLVAAIIISTLPQIAVCGNPEANHSAIVQRGDVRFTVLTPQLIRLEWSKEKHFEDKPSLVFLNRKLPVPAFTADDKADWLVISTDKLVLRYKKESGKFTPDNLAISFSLNGQTVTWHPGLQDTLNLKGTTRTLDGTNGEKDVALEDGLLSRSGWAVVDDSRGFLFDNSDWNWVTERMDGERQDLCFFGYGHEYRKVLFDFTRIAGTIPMPPRFAFGYWWSRYWTYSDDELRTLIREMRNYDVPIDVLIIDMDWHETYGLTSFGAKRDPFGQSVGWTGYTWNKNLFPDPGTFLAWTDRENLKTALNLHPASGIAPMEEKYDGFAQSFGFDTSGRHYIPFAIEDKKWTGTYFDVILHPLEKMGIDFFWLDWQQWLENKNVKGLSNTWWLNYVFFTEMEREGKKRPLLFHRWGGLGNHRYQIGFSGDTYITWESLSFQPYFTSTAGNVGYGYWSHDIGGHMLGEPTSEMYLRWLQFGIFSPIVRTHSTKSAELDRRIWKHGDYFELMRNALQLRYALVPYIYTASRKAFDSGVSICRPMYYDSPERQEAYDFKNQYMFGDDILVAPITEKVSEQTGLAAKQIWLPEGDWYEWSTGSMLKGGSAMERKFALHEIPVYLKAGSVIPMYPKRSNLQSAIDTLVLTVIPGTNGEAHLYEDDGTTSEYKNDQFAWTRITKKTFNDASVGIVVYPREGRYHNMSRERAYEVRMPSTFPPSSVVVNGKTFSFAREGKPDSWMYDASKLTTSFLTSMLACDKKTEIIIRWEGGAKGKENLLDGMPGLFGRLPKITKMMKDEVNRRDQIANAPALVLKTSGLPTRIQYQPEKAVDFLQEFDHERNDVIKQIMNYPRGDAKVLETIVSQFSFVTRIADKPAIKLEKSISDKPIRVEITSATQSEIRYTLDGSIPTSNSPLYTTPFTLEKTTTVKAKAFRGNYVESFPAIETFLHVFAKSVSYEHSCSPRYSGSGDFALVDGQVGTADNYRSNWVGFQQVDAVATIELLKPTEITSITARFMQNQESWIFLPTRIEYEVSTDGVNYRIVYQEASVGNIPSQTDSVDVFSYPAKLSLHNITHVRMKAKSIGVCPAWHEGAGGKAWVFVDEILIE